MLRGAIIGLGNIAIQGHVPAWRRRRDVEIVAATDARSVQRAELETHMPGARWYDSSDELLADARLDFVDISTPPSSHAPLARHALERGLHVLCEKPLVHSLDDLGALRGLAERTGRVLHTVHNWHHAPIVRRTAALVREGAIGRVTRVDWHTLRTRPAVTSEGDGENWRLDPRIAGGGVLADHGWHVFYVVQRWVGEAPRSVSARLETRRHTRWSVEDTATVRLAYAHATAEILLTWAADERRNWAAVTGTAGTLELQDDTLVLSRGGDGASRWPCPPALSGGGYHPDWFDAVAEQFLAEVTGQAPRGENLDEASLCVALEHSARASSLAGGRGVTLKEVSG
jgi:scyllo-inositol 2-dehydrogenase (NADP+)